MAEKWMLRLVFLVLLIFFLVVLIAPHIPAIAND
jgi:hypothetical protein